MLSTLSTYSVRRLCAIGASAVIAFIFLVISVWFGIHSVFLALKDLVAPDVAAAIIAILALCFAGVSLVLARLTMKPSMPKTSKPPSAHKSGDIGLEMGMLLAQSAQSYVKENPRNTLIAACLAGVAAGAAPDKAAALLKAAGKALQK